MIGGSEPEAGGGRRRAGPVPALSAAEECDLARRSHAGDREALRRLVEAHLPFVQRMARRYARYGASIQDLSQEGMLGLLQALERFNADGGARLSAFAGWWVRAAMQRHVIGSWSLVKLGTTGTQRTLFFRVRRLVQDLAPTGASVDLDRLDAALRALAERTATSAADLWSLALRAGGGDQSLNRPPPGSGHTGELIDLLPDPRPDPEAAAAALGEHRLCRSLVARALAGLPSRERTVIERRYLAEVRHSLSAVANELGLSKERVRQIEARAIERLRSVVSAELSALVGGRAPQGGRP